MKEENTNVLNVTNRVTLTNAVLSLNLQKINQIDWRLMYIVHTITEREDRKIKFVIYVFIDRVIVWQH